MNKVKLPGLFDLDNPNPDGSFNVSPWILDYIKDVEPSHSEDASGKSIKSFLVCPIPAPARDQGEVLGVEDKQAWALLNLLLAIGTALASIILVIRYFVGKKEDDEKNENAKEADKIKRHGGLRAFSILVAAGAIIAFILTEDMTLPMIWVDMWTILMVAIAVVQIIVMIAARRRKANGKNDKKPLDTDQEDAKSTTKPNTTKSSIDFKLSYEG